MKRQTLFPDPARGRQRAPRRAESGMAFIATMLVLMLVMATILIGVAALNSSGNVSAGSTGNGLMSTLNSGVKSTNTRMQQAAAFDLAESGLEYACEWLSEQSSPPTSNSSFCPSGWGQFPSSSSSTHATVNYGAGSFSVILYPLSTNQNGNGFGYLIESVGRANGATVTVQAYITQTNFGHYAYFSNYDDPAGWWVVGLNSFNGPMHSNDTNNNGASFTPTNILWYNNQTTNPMFQYLGTDAYTVSASTINWNVNNIGTAGSPSTASNWANIAAGGSNTVHTGTAVVPLPTASTVQLDAALGTTSSNPTLPSAVGVTIPTSNGATAGGIYINPGSVNGDVVNQITMSVQNSTTQVITIQQTNEAISGSNKNETTTITINPSANTTTVSTVLGNGGAGNTSSATYSGTTNGVVYVNGNIGTNTNSTSAAGGISGTIADNYIDSNGVTHYWGVTVATPSNDNANIDGSIVYNTAPTSANFITNAGSFGLVSDTVSVTSKDASNNNLRTVNIDGAVLAYNTFWLPNYTETPTGTFNLYGSYIAYNAGFFGQVTLGGSLVSGLAESYSYDSRLGVHPPPFFPTTGSTYTIQSWKMVNTQLQSS